MKIIHKDGYSEEEKLSYKSIIYNNIISAMKTLINGAQDLGIQIDEQVCPFVGLTAFTVHPLLLNGTN
jgi:hypothetical protein